MGEGRDRHRIPKTPSLPGVRDSCGLLRLGPRHNITEAPSQHHLSHGHTGLTCQWPHLSLLTSSSPDLEVLRTGMRSAEQLVELGDLRGLRVEPWGSGWGGSTSLGAQNPTWTS